LEDILSLRSFAALEEGHILSHDIFGCFVLWDNLTKVKRYQAMWLIENRHGIQ